MPEIRKIIGVLLFLHLSGAGWVYSQPDTSQPDITLNGYVKDLGMVMAGEEFNDPLYENLIHNRLNFRWFVSDKVTAALEVRNRIFYSERAELFSETGQSFGDYLNRQYPEDISMAKTWVDGERWVMHSVIDRLWVEYEHGPWEVTAGRQRINWGKNMVWNPNDLFNTYSYFDFDYEERPGSDALLIQYFKGYTSKIAGAIEPAENWDETIAAGLYSFHQWNYNFQVLGGWYRNHWMGGLGWSGYIKDAGFSGEVSWFNRRNPMPGRDKNYLVASVSGNYMFGNGTMLRAEGLYNGNDRPVNFLNIMNSTGMRANNLSLFKYAVFTEVSDDLHPLLRGRIGTIYYPEQSLVFLMPSLNYSVSDNWDLMLLAQLFRGQTNDLTAFPGSGSGGGGFNLISARLQWSF